MTQTLRDYQEDAVCNAGAFLSESPLIVAPTGAGKTTIGVHLVKTLIELGYSVCWIAHRVELLDQARERLRDEGVEGVFVESVQALTYRPVTDYDVYVIDEAHRAVAASYVKVLPRHAIRVGLTATPYRLDGRGLGAMFGRIIETPQTPDLVQLGHLLEPDVWGVAGPSMRGVKKQGGDFAVGAAEKIMNTPDVLADMVKHWSKRCEGLKTLCFATTIAHSEHIVEEFNAAGIRSLHVDGGSSPAERSDAIEALRQGGIDMLSNVLLFTEGFDLPEIGALVLARPTASLAMHMQMVGRVMRPSGSAIVHDHVGNHLRLGMVTQRFHYTLDDQEEVKRADKGEPLGMRTCPACYRMFPVDINECPGCGKPWTTEGAECVGVHGDAEMTNLSHHAIRERRFDELCEQAALMGWKDNAVNCKYKDEFDEWPPVAIIDEVPIYVNPETATMETKEAYYRTMLQLCIDKGWKHGAASFRFKELFGGWPKGFVTRVKDELGVGEDIKELWR